MNDYKFKRVCCGEVYDLRWTTECKQCGQDFLAPVKEAENQTANKLKGLISK